MGCRVVALERVEIRWETGGRAGRRDLRVRKRRMVAFFPCSFLEMLFLVELLGWVGMDGGGGVD
jgi:hypothetical protein